MEIKNKSIIGQMVYVTISGVQMLFVPNMMLSTWGFTPTNENYLRMMGMLVLALLFYYYPIAKTSDKKVVWGTVYGRLTFCAGLIIMGLMSVLEKPIIIFGLMETALALWTWRELKKTKA